MQLSEAARRKETFVLFFLSTLLSLMLVRKHNDEIKRKHSVFHISVVPSGSISLSQLCAGKKFSSV